MSQLIISPSSSVRLDAEAEENMRVPKESRFQIRIYTPQKVTPKKFLNFVSK